MEGELGMARTCPLVREVTKRYTGMLRARNSKALAASETEPKNEKRRNTEGKKSNRQQQEASTRSGMKERGEI